MSFHDIFSFSLLAFTSIFFIVNPIGAVPVFLSLTDGWRHADRVRASKRANLLACAVLLVFTLSGSLIFRLFGVTLGAFRIAGGILLMRVALDMLQGRKPETKATAEDKADAVEKEDIAITPIAGFFSELCRLPSTCGP